MNKTTADNRNGSADAPPGPRREIPEEIFDMAAAILTFVENLDGDYVKYTKQYNK